MQFSRVNRVSSLHRLAPCYRGTLLYSLLSPPRCFGHHRTLRNSPLFLASPSTAKRFCSTTHGNEPPLKENDTQPPSTPSNDAAQAFGSTSASAAAAERESTEELVRALENARKLHTSLVHHFVGLPQDRRVLYRDHLLHDSLVPLQKPLKELFDSLHRHVSGSLEPRSNSLTRAELKSLKAAWLSLRGMPTALPADAAEKTVYFEEIQVFYATLLASGVLSTADELRFVLTELQTTDLLDPSASFYESLFISLWSLADVRRGTPAPPQEAVASADKSTSAEVTPVTPARAPASELVAGETRELRRGLVGDLACHYMGHALAQEQAAPHAHFTPVRSETWELFFCTFANAQPAPKLMDLWWKRFLEWADAQPRAEAKASTAALPYQAVHAVLAWCAQSRDMERALKYFNAVNQRGVTLHDDTTPFRTLSPSLTKQFRHPGSLTAKATNKEVQQLQLALLVKLMASTKSVKLDGGLRALVVRDVQRQIDPAVLYAAHWGVLNDLLSGLSVPSAMQLLRRCSQPDSISERAGEKNKNHSSSSPTGTAASESNEVKAAREIPFFIWASLLRRCCREHLQDQAESLFAFLRHKFRLSVAEKRELVEIMMRMYVTMQPSDFPSALDLFLQHVLRTPPGEAEVPADSVLYELLIKGADSRNASMMLFLEACAIGVPLTAEVFEALMGATQLKTVAALSRKLPHDYATSALDAQLKIPAEADAHLRREEALRARGKPLYDSTGDAE